MADDSQVISYLIFCRKLVKMSQNLSSAAVVIGALRVNETIYLGTHHQASNELQHNFFSCSIITFRKNESNLEVLVEHIDI